MGVELVLNSAFTIAKTGNRFYLYGSGKMVFFQIHKLVPGHMKNLFRNH